MSLHGGITTDLRATDEHPTAFASKRHGRRRAGARDAVPATRAGEKVSDAHFPSWD
jgi:hypothetical protein